MSLLPIAAAPAAGLSTGTWLPSAISAGAGMFTAQQSIQAQEAVNKMNAQMAMAMMNQQRQWALEDWDRQTKWYENYNSPSQQMQRFKEAGLNPHLIYGHMSNSPAQTIRATSQEAPKYSADGIMRGYAQAYAGINDATQLYFQGKALENQTKLADAEVLKKAAETARTKQMADLIDAQWADLIMKPFYDNLEKTNIMEYRDALRNNLPTRAMAWERYVKETAKTDFMAKHAEQLYELALKENKLKQADVDFLEKIQAAPNGIKYGIELLKIILGRDGR